MSLFYPLVLCSPVLKPNFDLGLRQLEREFYKNSNKRKKGSLGGGVYLEALGEFAPPGAADVLVPLVLHLRGESVTTFPQDTLQHQQTSTKYVLSTSTIFKKKIVCENTYFFGTIRVFLHLL